MQKIKSVSKESSQLFRQAFDALQTTKNSPVSGSKFAISPDKKKPYRPLSFTRFDPPPSVNQNDRLNYKKNGISEKVMRKLSAGKITIEDELDLHGYIVNEAQKELERFLTDCHAKQYQYVRVIHGKGYGSVNGQPRLKNSINQWLREYNIVLAFCSAPSNSGGVGAVQILLKKNN